MQLRRLFLSTSFATAFLLGWHLHSCTAAESSAPAELTTASTKSVPSAGAENSQPLTDAPDDVETLIDRLGDDTYSDREAATKRLIEQGIGAKPLLLAALDSSDAEVRVRAQHVLDVVVAADRKQRIQAFRTDVDGNRGATLPGWPQFQKIAGSARPARELFVEMSQAEPSLLEAYSQGAQAASDALRQRCLVPALQPSASGVRLGNMRLSAGSMLALIFVASDPAVSIGEETAGNIISLPAYMEMLALRSAAASDPRREACLKLVGRWVARDVGSKYLPANLALAVHFNLKEGLEPAVKTLQQPQPTTISKCAALKLIAKFGGPEQIALVEPLLHDTTPCFETAVNKQPTQVQIRDFALAAMIRLNGQDLKEFGFSNADWLASADLSPSLIAFKNEHDRTAAFLRWQVWQKGQEEAARDKPSNGASRK
ncbi:MAG TPA: hypothetical protein VGI75_01690 [Pirellulales bacterium]|jgi:hypothetical protein